MSSQKKNSLKATMGPRRESGTPVAETFVGAAKSPAGDDGRTSQTSVRLPADLHKRARYYSIDHDVSLNQLIVEGLEMRLEQ
ncbi:toxin-antitoxin system HicB family antitoxin [Actinomyces sp. 594]|uniref:toxin-antitoxin system HicB family antitoxin n=1 Tax=Actinomyces sp. 594 TaxID=2057793 RepID=UPI001C584CE8|nr:toxin-antitoxin system HicB family antitoxin [Actinomyces sp. 594]MBW3069610.1 toxin-antitoxin system HicB family antitoxin [Actinomyces sp. 594]